MRSVEPFRPSLLSTRPLPRLLEIWRTKKSQSSKSSQRPTSKRMNWFWSLPLAKWPASSPSHKERSMLKSAWPVALSGTLCHPKAGSLMMMETTLVFWLLFGQFCQRHLRRKGLWRYASRITRECRFWCCTTSVKCCRMTCFRFKRCRPNSSPREANQVVLHQLPKSKLRSRRNDQLTIVVDFEWSIGTLLYWKVWLGNRQPQVQLQCFRKSKTNHPAQLCFDHVLALIAHMFVLLSCFAAMATHACMSCWPVKSYTY